MQQEQLGTENFTNSTEEKPNKENSLMTKKEAIDNTPFWLIQNFEEKKWFVVFGKHRITDEFPIPNWEITPQIALDTLEQDLWRTMVNVAAVVHASIAEEASKISYDELADAVKK